MQRCRPQWVVLAGVALAMLVGMTGYELIKDYVAPEISKWESHLITICFSTLVATVAAFFVRRNLGNQNAELRDLIQRKELLEEEYVATITELEEALAKIHQLRSLLPICSFCKKIRDDGGYWNSIEQYIQENTDTEFSHSVCPECMREHYPDIAAEMEREDRAAEQPARDRAAGE